MSCPSSIPQTNIIDIKEEDFPISDEKAAELLRGSSKPLSISYHPKKLFSSMNVIYETDTSKVYVCETKKEHAFVVVKKVRLRQGPLQNYVDLEMALSLLCGLCPQIVQCWSLMHTDKNAWLVMEYMDVGDLSEVRQLFNMSERHTAFVLGEVLKALVYLHKRDRIHRDVKTMNILVNSKGDTKLTDLGWCTQLTATHPRTQLGVGTLLWMAPEVHRGEPYGKAVDIWSLGITAFELATRLPPHSNLDSDALIPAITSGPAPELPDIFSADFRSFVSSCLQMDPASRLTAEQLLEHPFIKSACSSQEWLSDLKTAFPKWPLLE
eukprot:c8674_g1_i1.p1 GENE.c8674_g1_i1~~c8674_g1_i1.p1  ORF type:complete len:323 (-),score=129.14 c8674_g1_i1:219-1187(-)